MHINNFTLSEFGSTTKNVKTKKTLGSVNSGAEKANTTHLDAADISVSAKMTAQLKGLEQALYNINKAQSLVNVADGHLEQVQDILQKIRVLGVKSANGVYTSSDRQMFQVQVSALVDEVDRIASQAEYNRFKIMSGNFSRTNSRSSMWFHIGPNMDQRERLFIATFTASSLRLKEGNNITARISTPEGSNRTIGLIDNALHRVTKQRADLLSMSQRLKTAAEGTIRTMDKIMQSENVAADKNEIKQTIEVIKQRMQIK